MQTVETIVYFALEMAILSKILVKTARTQSGKSENPKISPFWWHFLLNSGNIYVGC